MVSPGNGLLARGTRLCFTEQKTTSGAYNTSVYCTFGKGPPQGRRAQSTQRLHNLVFTFSKGTFSTMLSCVLESVNSLICSIIGTPPSSTTHTMKIDSLTMFNPGDCLEGHTARIGGALIWVGRGACVECNLPTRFNDGMGLALME